MPRTRPLYPEQFRREAVELAKQSGRPLGEILAAENLEGQIAWLAEHLASGRLAGYEIAAA